MSGKKGSNSSLNVLEERVIGNLMDCGKASIEFKGHGHRRAHSYGSQGDVISYFFVICNSYFVTQISVLIKIQCNSSSKRSPISCSVTLYCAIGMGLAEMSKVDSYPPKFGSGGSTGANYSSPSTPPKRMLMYRDLVILIF